LKCYKGREQNKRRKYKETNLQKNVEKQGEKKCTQLKLQQDKAKKEEPRKVKERKEIKSYLNTVAGYITGHGANVKLKVSFVSTAKTLQVVKLRIQSGFENFDKI